MNPINIPRQFRTLMIEQALKELPNECCGLLLGKNNTVLRIIPMENIDPSPEAYFMDPVRQADIFTEMERKGEKLIGIYHSHPKGPAFPSETDLKTAFHPNTAYIIISLENPEKPELGAFMIENGSYQEVKLI